MSRSEDERQNRKVIRSCLKTESDCAKVTLGGSSFHRLALETGNAHLPTVVNDGTTGLFEEADLKLCQ